MRCFLLALALAACGGGDSMESVPPDAMPCADHSPVSFEHHVVPLIGHCGGENCHGNLSASWSYESLVNVRTRQCRDGRVFVKPGDPASSYLIEKLEGRDMCEGSRMPKNGPLPAAEVAMIAAWICQGAPNN